MNFLVIMADQLAARALAEWGGQAITPNIDKLIDNGVVFKHAYSNSPLCAPARFSMMSGQLPSKIGAYDNAAEFRSDIPTFTHYLRQNDFDTTLAGKMHFVGADQLHGFEHRTTTDIYPADFGWTPDWEQPSKRFPEWYHNLDSVKHSGSAEITNQLEYDDEVGQTALRKLRDLGRHQDQPFCLFVSFTHPHDPYVCRKPYWDRYKHIKIDLPRVPAIPRDHLDAHSQRLYDVSQTQNYNLTDQDIKRARRAYLGNISYLDDWVGQLVTTLRAVDRGKDTAIMLLSDHGDMLGERGLWYKMSFLQPSCHIPMLIYAPQHFKPSRVMAPVSLLDVFPTLVKLSTLDNPRQSGTALPHSLDGESLLPLLKGENTSLNERTILGEYLGEGTSSPCLMIRRGDWKYIYCETDPAQLYKLDDDPDELNNLAERADHRERSAKMLAEIHQRWQVKALRDKIIANQKDRRTVNRALRKGQYKSWDFQPFEDAGQRFMRNHLDLNDLESLARYPKLKL